MWLRVGVAFVAACGAVLVAVALYGAVAIAVVFWSCHLTDALRPRLGQHSKNLKWELQHAVTLSSFL